MDSIKRIKVFISCTSEIKEEINSINLIIEEIIKTSGKRDQFTIEALNWNRDVYSSKGVEVQSVVNEQIKDFDLLIGILWKKAGTPTKEFPSGSIEEMSLALEKNKNIMIFFNTQSPSDINEIDPEQLQIIKNFKNDLSDKGFLYKEYNSINNFESMIKIDLYNIIHDKILNQSFSKEPIVEVPTVSKYAHVYKAINTAEDEVQNLDQNFLEIIDKGTLEIETLTDCMNTISSIFGAFNITLNEYSNEITRAAAISDNRLRNKKLETTIKNVTELLISFNKDLEPQSLVFQEVFPEFGNTYTSLFIMVENIESDEVNEMRDSATLLKLIMEEGLNSYVSLLGSIRGVPPFNSGFNQAKRQTEIIIKNLTKSMLDGLLTLDNSKI